jgi:hypothetical protein
VQIAKTGEGLRKICFARRLKLRLLCMKNMAVINIPKRQYPVLKRLSELKEPEFSALLNGLNQIEASLVPDEFASHLAETVKIISPEDAKGFVSLLCGLYPAKENNNKTAAQIASDIKETLVDEKPLVFSPEIAANLKDRLEKLLSIDKAIAITAKAHDVVTEHQKVFCGARIFSDIRPVFSASADSVSAAVVVHSLNISYHEGGDHKDFFVALDNSEIEELKMVIERAEKKSRALHSIIKKTGVKYLGEEGDHV